MPRICRLCGARNESDACLNPLCRGYNKPPAAPVPPPASEQPVVPAQLAALNPFRDDECDVIHECRVHGRDVSQIDDVPVVGDLPPSRRVTLNRIAQLQNKRLIQERAEIASALTTQERLVRIARYQRWVMLAFLSNLIALILGFSAQFQPLPISIPMFTAAFVLSFHMLLAVFLLSRYTYSIEHAVMCSVGMLFPCISLIVLVLVNAAATRILQEHGVYVGFLGADASSITDNTNGITSS